MEEEMAAFSDCWDKLRLPDAFDKLLDGREPREVTLRDAGGGGRLWDVDVVFDGEGHMYLERGWEQFARAHHLRLGNVLVFSDEGDAAQVFDASTCRRNYPRDDADSNSTSSAEIGMGDAPTSQFTITLKERHLGVRQQQYLNVPPEFQNAHGFDRGLEQFARAHHLRLWNVLVFSYDCDAVQVFDADLGSNGSSRNSSSAEIDVDDEPTSQFTITLKKCHSGVRQQQYDGDAVLTVKVFDGSTCSRNYQHDDANTGSNNSFDSSSNSSSSAEIDIEDAPTSQFTVMLKLKECHLDVRQQKQYLSMPPEFQNVHGCEERSKVSLQMPRKSWPMNLKHNIFLVTTALLICCIIATPTTDSCGYFPISNMNDPEVLEIARWAVAEHARQANDGLQFKRVVSGMELVVEGRNYNLSIDTVNGDGKEYVYIAQVYDISWLHNRTLESFTLGPSTGVCRLDDHPTSPPTSRCPHIRPTFLVLLCSWSLFMFIQFQ